MAEHVPSGEVPTRLGSSINGKILGRLSFSGLPCLLPGSSRNLTINGNLALTALFDYTQSGQAMNELYTWVWGRRIRLWVWAPAACPRHNSARSSRVLTAWSTAWFSHRRFSQRPRVSTAAVPSIGLSGGATRLLPRLMWFTEGVRQKCPARRG